MRHDQGVSVGLVKGSRRYREYESTIDEQQGTAKYRLSGIQHIHAGPVSRVAFSKMQDDEEEVAVLLLEFDEAYKMYTASTLEVRVGVDRGEGEAEPMVCYLDEHDIKTHESDPEIVLPRPLLTRRLHQEIPTTKKNTNPGCISVFLTRGHVYGGHKYRDWNFTPAEFQRIKGKNGETLCFEFQCRPRRFDFSAPERFVVDEPQELEAPLGGSGAPNSEPYDAAHMTATAQDSSDFTEVSTDVSRDDSNAPLLPHSGIERPTTDSPVKLPATSPTLSRKRKANDETPRDVSAPRVAGTATTGIEAKTKVSSTQVMSNQEAQPDGPTKPEYTDALQADRCGFQSGTTPSALSCLDAPVSTTRNFIDLTGDDVVIKREREPVDKQCSSKHVIPQVEEHQDEEDLELELKKIEIQQKLKAIRRKKAAVKTEE